MKTSGYRGQIFAVLEFKRPGVINPDDFRDSFVDREEDLPERIRELDDKFYISYIKFDAIKSRLAKNKDIYYLFLKNFLSLLYNLI